MPRTNRNKVRRLKEVEAKTAKELKQKALNTDLMEKAKICRKFVNDKRHEEFKDLFQNVWFSSLLGELLALPGMVKSADEFNMKAMEKIAKMNTVTKIFSTPQVFFDAEKEILKGEK